jgi:predicted lipoprotein
MVPSAGGGGGSPLKAAGEKSFASVVKEAVAANRVEASTAFDSMAGDYREMAEVEGRRAAPGTSNPSIAARLGGVLVQRKLEIAQVMREWDPNGDGSITRMEFRQVGCRHATCQSYAILPTYQSYAILPTYQSYAI